jgi:hypothetical protein
MIYLFHGTDVLKARTKAFEWVAKARAKEPNLAYIRLAREEITSETLESVSSSGGLFVQRLLVLIDDPFPLVRTKNDDEDHTEEETSGSVLEEHLDALMKSDNAIVLLAPKLSASKAKNILPSVKVEYKFVAISSQETIRGFNNALVNALATRSREKLWVELNRATLLGDSPEMLHGLLHWKARDLMEKGSRIWKPTESRALSLSLIEILQESRRGGLDLRLALEQFALSL